MRDGAKGPLVVEVVKRRVAARTEKRQEDPEELLVVIHYKDRDEDRVLKTDYYLSDRKSAVAGAPPNTDEAELARAAKAEHRIEECLRRAKSEAGLADYEVRNWKGWHHHQILSLIATWFLVTETRRGKKMDPGNYGSSDPRGDQFHPAPRVRMRYSLPHPTRMRAAAYPQRTRAALSLETT